ncbi:MAG: cytidine deaminase [Prolixibacteraceae bacterium]|jgi:cytidine deaminase|nr:cytidine deaminase [Prolixibacteraceae bacterium]
MKTKEIRIYVREYTGLDELNGDDRQLLQLARQTAQHAYAPYSGFRVGAAIELANGERVTGNNQENMAYPSGLCAERVALFTAGARFPDVAVKTLAVTAINKEGKTPAIAAPCGACRQVMLESEVRAGQNIRIILDGQPITVLEGVGSLLPLNFKQEYL